MAKPLHPCYDVVKRVDCPNRVVGCHATCEKWADYVKERDAEYEKNIREKETYNVIMDKREKEHYRYVMHGKKR